MSHIYICEMDLASTYALSSPKLAKECCRAAIAAAREMGRPDLAYRANDFLAALGG